MSKSNEGFIQIASIMVIAASVSALFVIKQHQATEAFRLIETQQSRADVQSRISSGVNLVGSLIAAKYIQASGDSKLVGLTLTPGQGVGGPVTPGCPVSGATLTTSHDAGLWKYTAGTTTTKAKIEMNLCAGASGVAKCGPTPNESLVLTFTGRDTANTDPDSDIVYGELLYNSLNRFPRPVIATYRLSMEIPRMVTGAGGGAQKCAIFIGTRGSHWTNAVASSLGKFPNWGDASPHYNWWQMAYPHPLDLSTVGKWQGVPGQSRFTSLSLPSVVDSGHFAPCNRMYAYLWSCTAWYKAVPLTKQMCGRTLQTFTNQTPGSGACGADCNCYLGVQVSPLVVDLKGQGVQFTSGLRDQVKFDMGSGPDKFTPWIRNPESVGFLAYDKNGNGKIDSTHELFGDKTILEDGLERDNGFLALAHYDQNSDRVIDKNDEIFSRLTIWRDLNKNGMTDPGELSTLANESIVSISLKYDSGTKFEDENGNRALFSSYGTLANGRQVKIYDVYFSGPGSKANNQKLVSSVKLDDIEFKQ